ncbi:hypothetical protein ATCM_07145 [Stenotrophomonas sp. ATCM1_4]|uniref:Transmembrane protein n=1 Tax=Stenotrophomonas capsici TaxID=3110230 RepID=A0ABU5V9R5_9GAMM|nr:MULTISPECIES: hypothetical protein [unclassified Stenotrophomonas]MEA5669449.1 hypothetical protein [Stenotrophomonas sp. MH1]TDB27454.1 hypothetical protein ATCM_07145 [Stenotrophomonas sp. ATCM1_4]
MNSTELLSTLLVSIGYRLPIIIALGVAVMMVFDTPSSRPRQMVLWGLSVLLLCTVVGGGLAVLPLLFLAQGNYGALSGLNTLLSVVHIGLSLLEAAGFILLAWGVAQALRRPAAGGKP